MTQNDNPETSASMFGIGYVSQSAAQGNFFSSISGTGLSGTFVTPTDTDRYLALSAGYEGGLHTLRVNIRNTNPTGNLGLTFLNGTTAVTKLELQINSANLPFHYPVDGNGNPVYVDPATYFATYNDFPGGTTSGSFMDGNTANSIYPQLRFYYSSTSVVDFTATSVTISTASAVPEPSTYAALVGIVALGVVAVRRRRSAT